MTTPKRRWFLITALCVLGTGVVWFGGSIAFFTVGIFVESRGGHFVVVPDSIGFLIYLGPWLAGPLLIVVGSILSVVALIVDRR